MNKLLWFLRMLFSPHKTEQEKIEWWWWLKIDLPYWWDTLPFVEAFQQCVHWTLRHVPAWRNKLIRLRAGYAGRWVASYVDS